MDLIDKTIDGRYRVLRRLGAGGMGEVFVAHQTNLARDVALKVLPERDTHAAEVAERFSREARALSRVRHDNVVVVYDTGICENTGIRYISMELLNGETLRARMRRPVGLDEANGIITQLLHGLDAVHSVGLVHRDIKPENIILVDGRVKLVDFGIARRMDGAATLTQTGAFVGTPGYAAPELAFGDRGDDPRGDLYAVGVVWFELLTSSVLFDGPSALAIAMRHVSEPAPRVSTRIAVDDDIDDVVAALLAKTPEARPSLRMVLDVLDRRRPALPALGSTTAPSAPTTHAASSTPPPSRFALASPPTSFAAITETMTSLALVPAAVPPPPDAATRLENPWLTATYDDSEQLVQVQRTERDLEVADVAPALSWVGTWPRGVDHGAIVAIFDLRGRRAQLAPAFADAMRLHLLSRLGNFRAASLVVRSPTARLQITRLLRELGLDRVEVFHDVDEARGFVGTARKRP